MSEISFQKIPLNSPDQGFKIEMFQNEICIGILIINYFQQPLLYEITILPDCQRQGCGTKLLEFGCEEIKLIGLNICYFINNNQTFWQKIKIKYPNCRINGVRFIEINTDP